MNASLQPSFNVSYDSTVGFPFADMQISTANGKVYQLFFMMFSSNIPQKISSKCEMNGMLIFCLKSGKKSPLMFTMTKDNNNIAMDLIHIEHGQYYHC